MDTLKQQLLRIQQQLAGLTASQKMLTASLVAIMVMTLFYWSHYAGSAELVPLIDKSLTADEMSQIKSSLQSKGVKFELVGDKIMVSPDAKFGIVADLGFDQALPRDMTSAFDEIVAQMSPLDSGSKNQQFYNHAREKTLAAMISRWPGVKSATVMIDATMKNSPLHQVNPTAAVDITMKTGESPSKKTVESARMSLCGAQAGLDAKDVRVTINGQSFESGDSGDAMSGGDNYALKNKSDWEKYYGDKIVAQIPYIHGLYATVSVTLTTVTTDIFEHKIDPKSKVEALRHQTTSSEENSQSASGGEPGVVPNTSVNADTQIAAAPQTSTKETTEIENQTDIGRKDETTHAPPGDAVAVTAAVRVPESYFRKVWKMKNPSAAGDATDAEIDALVKRESPHILDAIKSATNIKEDTAISVASYVDVDAPILSGDAAPAGLAALPLTVGFGAKEIAIGALAVISLFMVSMMVRKSAPQPALASIGAQGSALGGGIDLMSSASRNDYTSEVSEGGAMMTGHELTDEAIEAKNVIEQVDAMVKANPDAAANLLKQWMRN